MSKQNIEQHPSVRYTKHIIPKDTWLKARAAALLEKKTLAEWLTRAIEEKYKGDSK